MREIDDIHMPFLAWLNELKIPRVYHRPDRKSGIQTGWPDFTVAWMGRVVFIEAKTPDGRLSKVQENVHAFIRASGNRVEVCRSLEECKEAVKNILCENTLSGEKRPCKHGLAESKDGLNAGLVQPDNDPPAQNFYIGSWNGNPYVFAPDQRGAFRMIREASAFDRLRLPKLPA